MHYICPSLRWMKWRWCRLGVYIWSLFLNASLLFPQCHGIHSKSHSYSACGFHTVDRFSALTGDYVDLSISFSHQGHLSTTDTEQINCWLKFNIHLECDWHAMKLWDFRLTDLAILLEFLLQSSKLGVPIKTTISANVLEEAINGTVTVRPLPLGRSLHDKVMSSLHCFEHFPHRLLAYQGEWWQVEKQGAHFYRISISDAQADAGIVVRVTSTAQSKFKASLKAMRFISLPWHSQTSAKSYLNFLKPG